MDEVSSDEYCLPHPLGAMTANVASDLASTCGVTDGYGLPQIEGFDYGREVVGIAVHVVVG